jgi:hypothetical protein
MNELSREEAQRKIRALVDAGLIEWQDLEIGASGYALTPAGLDDPRSVLMALEGCSVPWAGMDLRG